MLKQLIPWLLISLTATSCISDKEDDDDNQNEDTAAPPPPPAPTGLTLDGMYFFNWLGYVGSSPVSTEGACSDATITVQADCEAAGSCSDGTSADEATCVAASGTWTLETWTEGGDLVTLTEVPPALFSIYLLDSVKSDACVISWAYTNADLTPDDALLSGTVPDAFDDGEDNTSWWGYTITGVTPTTGGTCDNWEDEFSQGVFDALMNQETPGFGFGPPNDDIDEALENTAEDYETAKNYAFTGFMSLTILNQGTREYYDLNSAYLYDIADDGTPGWDPQGQTYPQGPEIEHSQAAFADGFYYGQPIMQIGWGAQ